MFPYVMPGTGEHQACIHISAKLSTALTSETSMATSWHSGITPHNSENVKPGAALAPHLPLVKMDI